MADDLPSPDTAPAGVDPQDALLRTGTLTDDQARLVVQQQATTGEGFDRTAVALALATDEDVAAARRALHGSVALQLAPTTAVSDEIVVLSDPAGPRAEALRLLRTQIIAQHVGAGCRAFAVAAARTGLKVMVEP